MKAGRNEAETGGTAAVCRPKMKLREPQDSDPASDTQSVRKCTERDQLSPPAHP